MRERVFIIIALENDVTRVRRQIAVVVRIIFDDQARTFTVISGMETSAGARSQTVSSIGELIAALAAEVQQVADFTMPPEMREHFHAVFRELTRGVMPDD